ncbi:glycosyltransferase [Candidatus Palauibacter sp.]|uniref:glycosyltransferase n=1 Tax=Candidatus Palauibacter sp. TaxID=3101350 RepID=UPI003B529534
MKILDVAEFYAEAGGGVKTYIEQKLATLPVLGHEVVIVAPGARDAESPRPGGRVIWVRSPRLPFDRRYRMFASAEAVRSILERERPDVLECSSPWSAASVCSEWTDAAARSLVLHQDPIAVYPGTLLSSHIGEDRMHRIFGWHWRRTRKLTRRFDATVVASHWYARRLRRFGAGNTRVIPLGIHRDRFARARRDPALRRELLERCGLGEGAALLVAVGRHHPEKRIGTLIEAMERVNEGRSAGLVLFGDGPLRRWIERRAAKAGGVHVAGQIRDHDWLTRALASADVFLHGSSAETFGLAVAEAMSAGLPVVTPDDGAAADLVHPRFSATYPAGDSAACADAIAGLLERLPEIHPDLVRRFAAGRIQTAESHFRALMLCYEGILNAKARPVTA